MKSFCMNALQLVKSKTWLQISHQGKTTAVIFGIGLCLLMMHNIGWTDSHLKVIEEAKQIVLKGEISKALGEYDEHLQGAVEYLICGREGKEYESIIVVEATAKHLHDALGALGVKHGSPPGYDVETDEPTDAKGPGVVISVEWTVGDKTQKVRAEDLVRNVKTQKTMKHVAWVYSGSRIIPDLDSEDEDAMLPQAFMSNDIVALRRFDGGALFQNPLPESSEENIYKKNEELLPPLGTPVTVTFDIVQKMQYYILISGKVQGVGFRNFTQRNAKQLGVNGYAMNLSNGKVEVVAEADKTQLDALVKLLKQGPRFAHVDALNIDERPFTGEYETFEIRFRKE